MRRPQSLLLCAGVLLTLCSCRSPVPTTPKSVVAPVVRPALLIIPRPKRLVLGGPDLRVGSRTRLWLTPESSPLDRMAARSVQAALQEQFGLPVLPIVPWHGSPLPPGAIVLGEPSRSPALARLLRHQQSLGVAKLGVTKPEGYTLWVRPTAAIIAGADPAGTFYGAQTLCQMLTRDPDGNKDAVFVPGAVVDDWPSLRWRGVHLFLGNHALPFHEKLISRVLAPLKFNNLVLQCEQAHWKTLGKAAPPWAMSKQDLTAEIGFARAHGLTVTPLVESIGHMPWLFADPHNLPLAEDPQTPYAANAADPRTDQFLFNLYDEVLDTFGSAALHIGGDEVNLRGRYPCRSRAVYPTLASAYIAQVTRLHGHLKKRGVQTWLWSDMLLSPGEARDGANAPSPSQAASMRAALPKDIVLTDWHYQPDDPFTSPQRLRRAGFGPVIGATWATPANIAGFSRALSAGRQRGLLQTTWAGYNSSEANFRHEKHQFVAFVQAAEDAWNGGPPSPVPTYDPAQVFDRLYGHKASTQD